MKRSIKLLARRRGGRYDGAIASRSVGLLILLGCGRIGSAICEVGFQLARYVRGSLLGFNCRKNRSHDALDRAE